MSSAAAYSQWSCILHNAKEGLVHRLQCENTVRAVQYTTCTTNHGSPGEEESQPDRRLVKIVLEKLWYNGFKLREIL